VVEGDVYKLSGIYGLHKGVIQVILNSIEFEIEMHKQTEIFINFDSKKRPTQGFCIYIYVQALL